MCISNGLGGVISLKNVRLATIDDVTAMSFIHAQTWKSAYTKYISDEYLNNITDEGWIPLFTRAFTMNLHDAAVFEQDGKITGTVTFGPGKPVTTCTTSTTGNMNETENTNFTTIKYSNKLQDNNCCDTGEMVKQECMPCNSINNLTKLESNGYKEDLSFEGQIISLYVLPEHWSTKQGYQLTKFAIDRLKIQGYKSCYLWVIKENEKAVNFYKKFGFISTDELTTVMLAGKPVVEEKYRISL
jgi:ribosomal protein S18 acetylase RimI-like enzyme